MRRAALLNAAAVVSLSIAMFAWGWVAGSREAFPHRQILAVRTWFAPASPPAAQPPMYTNPNAMRAGQADSWLQTRPDIVMAGDSITAAGRWSEMFPDARIVNRGIPGDTVSGLLARARTIAATRPRSIFVLIGINDVLGGNDNGRILVRYRRALDTLADSGARIAIQSTLQCSTTACTPAVRAQIDGLNAALMRIAVERGWRFVDLNARLSDGNGLKPAYTYDGVHLNGAGYRLWRETIGAEVAATPSGRDQPLDR